MYRIQKALSCPPPPGADREKKSAFTLAETLIVLGIIGVIAALTIPNLIVKYQKQTTTNKLKKCYTLLSEAVKLSEIDNGPVKNWQFETLTKDEFFNFFEKYLIPYLKKTTVTEDDKKEMPIIKLVDGTIIKPLPNGGGTTTWDMTSTFIEIDLSGGKNINKYTWLNTDRRTIFYLYLNKEEGLTFYKALSGTGTEREKLINNPYFGCNKNTSRAVNCFALIQYDGWEIKDDYPW